MTIIGVVGAIGSGKSFTQLKTALEFANLKGKGLVFNFRINRQALIEYCSLPVYADKWYADIAFNLEQLRYVFLFHRWFLFPKLMSVGYFLTLGNLVKLLKNSSQI